MMKKLVLFLAAFLPLTMGAQEEAKKWDFKGVAGLNMSQTSLSNWAAGGENTLAGNLYLNAAANYKQDKWSWDNSLVADFGQTYSKTNKWQTSVDKLNLTSKGGYAFAPHWSASALVDFLTQFSRGYNSAQDKNTDRDSYISTFFAPAYLTLALGADYRPSDNFSVLIAPLTGKMTFVLDKKLSDAGMFGVDPGKKVFSELGASVVANYQTKLLENITLMTKLSLFTAYTHRFGNIDVNWDMMLSARLNKYMSTTLTTNLIYDDDIKILKDGKLAPRVQFREIFGIGLAYNF